MPNQTLFYLIVALLTYLNKLLDPYDNSSIIRGRTGVGKSALLHMVMNHAYKCRQLDPNDISIRFLEQSDIIAFFEALNVNLDMFYKILWRHILIMELLKLRHDIRSETDTNNFFSGIMSRLKKDEVKKKAIEYFREWGDKFWIDTDAHLKEITRKLEQDTKASIGGELKGVALNAEYAKKLTEEQILDVKKRAMEVVSGLQIKKLNEILALLADYSFDDPQKKYFIIIDQLDENWAENETRYKFIRALIEEIKVFRKIKNIKIIVALRLDLLRSVFNLTRGSGFQEEKYESYILDIKWTPEQLTELVQKRVSEVYRRQYTRENVKIQDIFPKPKGGPTGLTPLEYIIERTLLRPRDVLQYVNECFSIALDRERISWGTIQKAESAYSQKRLRSLKEEWGDIYPSFEETVEILRNLPDRFSRNEILRNNIDAVITELSVQGTHDPCAVSANKMLNGENREADVINEILLCVYNLGIVGFKVSSLTPYKWSFRDSTPATKNEIKRASGMKIHKMLHSALNIRINAEKRFEKEKEELENEADND